MAERDNYKSKCEILDNIDATNIHAVSAAIADLGVRSDLEIEVLGLLQEVSLMDMDASLIACARAAIAGVRELGSAASE
eukprot:scaffold7895_cov229-Pinguiococcus_pyrenoidosus.AAC.6